MGEAQTRHRFVRAFVRASSTRVPQSGGRHPPHTCCCSAAASNALGAPVVATAGAASSVACACGGATTNAPADSSSAMDAGAAAISAAASGTGAPAVGEAFATCGGGQRSHVQSRVAVSGASTQASMRVCVSCTSPGERSAWGSAWGHHVVPHARASPRLFLNTRVFMRVGAIAREGLARFELHATGPYPWRHVTPDRPQAHRGPSTCAAQPSRVPMRVLGSPQRAAFFQPQACSL